MPDQVLRRLRLWSLGKVGLRTDHRKPDVRSDAHRNHVFGDLLAPTHTCIVTFCNNVGQAIVDDNLDLYVRIFGQESFQLRPQDRLDGMISGRNPNAAGGLVPKFANGRQLSLDLLEARTHALQQALAGLSRRYAARGAGQKPDSEPRL